MPIGIYAPPGPRDPRRKPLEPDEADSAIKQLAGHTTSLLQSGLEILDKPGRAVRGVLGGHYGEALAALPLSDTLGITDPANKVSGRDLTDKVGLTSRHSNSFASSLPGFGVELLTDPTNYLSFGTKAAATEAGRALAKSGATRGWTRRQLVSGFDDLESTLRGAGATTEDIAHMRNRGAKIAGPADEASVARTGGKLAAGQPLAGLAGVGLPFVPPSLVLGTGARAVKVAGAIDSGVDKLRFGNAIGRSLGAMFDPSVREATGPATQRAMARYGTPALDDARVAARQDTADTIGKIHAALAAGFDEGDVLRAGRIAGEGSRMRNVPAGLEPLATEIGATARRGEKNQLAESMKVGLPLHDAADPFVNYLPRQGVHLAGARDRIAGGKAAGGGVGPLAPGTIVPTASSANYHRDDLWRGIPGGTEMVNDWVRRFAGNPGNLTTGDIAKSLRKDMAAEHLATRGAIPAEVRKQIAAKSQAVANRLAGMDADHAAHGIGLFSNDLTRDVARSGEQHARTIASAHAVLGLIGDEARRVGTLAPDAVPVSQALDDLKMITRPGNAATGSPIEGALVEAHRNLARQGAGPVDALLHGDLKSLRGEVDQFALPRSVYDELVKSHAKWNTPETAKGPLGAFDQLTAAFKNLSYPLWPASHVRNAASAALNNLGSGTGLRDHVLQAKLMRGTATAADLAKSVPDLPAGLTDDAARQWVRNRQFATGKVYDGHSGQFDLDRIAEQLQGNAPGQSTPAMPGSDRVGGGSFLRDAAALVGGKLGDQAKLFTAKLRHPLSGASPLEMNGVLGGRKDFPALELGRAIGGNVEDLFRGSQWLGATRAGRSADEAGRLVADTHFDYSKATDFERNVMRRLVPFYTFSRNNLPAQAAKLAQTPGQITTQMRTMGLGRKDDDYVPDYLAGGVAIPTGPEAGGKRQFVSSLGTPLEEALEPFRFKGGLPDITGSAMAFAARMNPLLKAPIEQLLDTQFHTGRKLSSLRAPSTATALGRLVGDDNPQLLSQILVNTPATRFVTALDKLVDDRKGPLAKLANLASGVKVTDVDLDRSQAAEAAQARNDLLAGMPHVRSHTSYYARPEDTADLSPEEVALLRLQTAMGKRARDQATATRQP